MEAESSSFEAESSSSRHENSLILDEFNWLNVNHKHIGRFFMQYHEGVGNSKSGILVRQIIGWLPQNTMIKQKGGIIPVYNNDNDLNHYLVASLNFSGDEDPASEEFEMDDKDLPGCTDSSVWLLLVIDQESLGVPNSKRSGGVINPKFHIVLHKSDITTTQMAFAIHAVTFLDLYFIPSVGVISNMSEEEQSMISQIFPLLSLLETSTEISHTVRVDSLGCDYIPKNLQFASISIFNFEKVNNRNRNGVSEISEFICKKFALDIGVIKQRYHGRQGVFLATLEEGSTKIGFILFRLPTASVHSSAYGPMYVVNSDEFGQKEHAPTVVDYIWVNPSSNEQW